MAKASGTDKKTRVEVVTIPPPKFQEAEFKIIGDSAYVQNRMSAKAVAMMRAVQEEGSTSKKGKKREPRDFKEDYKNAQHKSTTGWNGIPASAFRCAMISACSAVGFHMTKAKMSVFVLADGVDVVDGTPLVKITKGKPHAVEHTVRNKSGVCDIRSRPMWDEGWTASVKVRFDADQFRLTDVTNLMMRAGIQVGVGEGRHFSKDSCGMGWGTFTLAGK